MDESNASNLGIADDVNNGMHERTVLIMITQFRAIKRMYMANLPSWALWQYVPPWRSRVWSHSKGDSYGSCQQPVGHTWILISAVKTCLYIAAAADLFLLSAFNVVTACGAANRHLLRQVATTCERNSHAISMTMGIRIRRFRERV